MSLSLCFLLVPSHSPLVLGVCSFVCGSLLVRLYSFHEFQFVFSFGTLCLFACLW